MTDIFIFIFLVKRAGRHFGFFKRAGRHEKGAGRRALQKKPRQNTEYHTPQEMYTVSNDCNENQVFTPLLPDPGIELRTTVWQADMLTTTPHLSGTCK